MVKYIDLEPLVPILLWLGLIVLAPSLLRALFSLLRWSIRRRKLLRLGIKDIDSLDGHVFEELLQAIFESQGYEVELTPLGGDYGADLILVHEGVRTAVQAKRSCKNVGLKAVQQVVAAMAKYDCDDSIVVTNSYFTKPAEELAEANDVELCDRDWLMKAILRLRAPKSESPSLSEPFQDRVLG